MAVLGIPPVPDIQDTLRPVSRPQTPGSTRMIQLLYVDDDPESCSLIEAVCEKTGNFAVQTLGSGTAALMWMKFSCVDVIVSADNLQGMTGLGLLQSLRKSGDTTPFILFAQDCSDRTKKEALKSGATGVVGKNDLGRNALSQLMRSLYWAAHGS